MHKRKQQHLVQILRYNSERAHGMSKGDRWSDIYKMPENPRLESAIVDLHECPISAIHLELVAKNWRLWKTTS